MQRVLVCASCFDGLRSLGADPITEKRVGSLLDRCEAHPSRFGVHASLALHTDDATIAKWRAANPEPPLAPVDYETVGLVAKLAVLLLAGQQGHGVESSEVEVQQAVVIARNVLAAAKGEAFR